VDAGSLFNTSFARPKSGSCKVVAKFAGTGLYAASKDTTQFPC